MMPGMRALKKVPVSLVRKVRQVASKFKLTAFENTSILRKLTILYFIMSIVPVGVLYYLYLQVKEYGRIEITEESFNLTLTFVVLGVGVGYATMRTMLMKIVDIAKDNRDAVSEILGPDKIKSLSTIDRNEITVLAQSFNEITSRLEENIRNLELAKKTLHSVLARVGEGISSMEDIDSFLTLIVETVAGALQSNVGLLFLLDEKKEYLQVKAVHGKDFGDTRQFRIDHKGGIFAPVIDSKKAGIIEKISKEWNLVSLLQAPLLCAPLVLHDDVLGVIVVCGRRAEGGFDEEEVNLLQNLALQTAVAIENSKLNEDVEQTYFETISALALAVEARDPYSRGHSDRVASFSLQIAGAMNLGQEDIAILRDAARLHDIGKIGVTDKVLKKPGRLTADEMDVMKKHPEIGEGIIRPIRSLRDLCDIIRHHHEKLDGSGYPDGLKGEDVHLLVRILGIADIFDALTTTRPYRKSFSREKAIDMLRDMKGQVDPRIVDVLTQVVK